MQIVNLLSLATFPYAGRSKCQRGKSGCFDECLISSNEMVGTCDTYSTYWKFIKENYQVEFDPLNNDIDVSNCYCTKPFQCKFQFFETQLNNQLTLMFKLASVFIFSFIKLKTSHIIIFLYIMYILCLNIFLAINCTSDEIGSDDEYCTRFCNEEYFPYEEGVLVGDCRNNKCKCIGVYR